MGKTQKKIILLCITAGIALALIWGLYRSEFSYSNTEAGRLLAISEYIPKKEGNPIQGIGENDEIREIAHQERDGILFVAFAAENASNIHGILQLERGPLGNYRPISANYSPFPYRAGAYLENAWTKEKEEYILAVAGEGCQDIAALEAVFHIYAGSIDEPRKETLQWPVTEPEFLWLFTGEEICNALNLAIPAGATFENGLDFTVSELRLLDSAGKDVTEQYRIPSVDSNWSTGVGSAEQWLVYVLMGLVAVIALVIGRFIWLGNKREESV